MYWFIEYLLFTIPMIFVPIHVALFKTWVIFEVVQLKPIPFHIDWIFFLLDWGVLISYGLLLISIVGTIVLYIYFFIKGRPIDELFENYYFFIFWWFNYHNILEACYWF